MKTKILMAFILLAVGLIYVTDWIVFSLQPENEKLPWENFKSKYYKRFPESLQQLIENKLFTPFIICCFGIAGLIFINDFVNNNNNKKVYFIIGIFSFIMASWQIFSLM